MSVLAYKVRRLMQQTVANVENRSLAQISVSLTALSPVAVGKELRQQLCSINGAIATNHLCLNRVKVVRSIFRVEVWHVLRRYAL